MYFHKPTGKSCRIIATDGARAFCNFGGFSSPFTWVDSKELGWAPDESASHAQPAEVKIIGFNISEPEMLSAVIDRLRRHQHVETATITCNSRKIGGHDDGWLEYGLFISYYGGGSLYIGCIQRKPSEQFEFHT